MLTRPMLTAGCSFCCTPGGSKWGSSAHGPSPSSDGRGSSNPSRTETWRAPSRLPGGAGGD
eukprot:3810630-Pyramimonas_sp.AAC.1